MLAQKLKQCVNSLANIHRPDGSPNLFIFSVPRSGSTWLMELICSQPGFKCCDDPLDLRNDLVRRHLGIGDWTDLYRDEAMPALLTYFQGFCDGRLRFKNVNPLHRNYYHPLTHRIVFKMIHGAEDRIDWFRETFNGRIVYLVRHPIAVSLSREVFPTLPAMLTSDYRWHFTAEQLEYAASVLTSGTELDRGVLSWCLQTVVPLREATDDWTVVTYEQMILDPVAVISHLATRLDLPDPTIMLDRATTPSSSTRKSDRETQRIVKSGPSGLRRSLVEKWRTRITETEERATMSILDRFGLDIYAFGDVLPRERFWIGTVAHRDAWCTVGND